MNEFLTQFHFLRPEALYLLLACPFIAWLLRQRHTTGNDWNRAIAPELLQHLSRDPGGRQKRRGLSRSLLLSGLTALAIVALAGPTWQQKSQPVVQVKDDMVVILDLSISMLATDVQPNRLTRTKQKLQDLLSLRTEGNTALIVFSGDTHVVTPLTDDTNTIAANLPALDPFMMPVIGSRPDLAVTQALNLLDQGKASSGRILMLTDGIEPHQQERIRDALGRDRVTLDILAVGTAHGGPIDLGERGYLKDQGSVVIPKTDLQRLQEVAGENGGAFSAITLNDDDLFTLDVDGSKRLKQMQQEGSDSIERNFDRWEDAGFWLLLMILPGILLAHRQGAFLVIFICLLPLQDLRADTAGLDTIPEASSNAASFWSQLWQTPDQKGQQLLKQQDYKAAAETFESTEHKAYAQYKAGQYQAATETLPPEGEQASSRVLYNRGNALAQQMQLEAAIEAYEKAIEADPDNDDARFNKKLLEEFLRQQQKQQSESQDQQGEQQEQNQDQQGDSGQNSDNSSSGSSQQNDESSQNQQGQSGNREQSPDQQSQADKQQDAQGNQQDDANDTDGQQGNQADEDQQQGDRESTQTRQQTPSDAKDSSESQQKPSNAMLDELSQEERQSFEQWMRRVPDDPGGLLRRKFEQQSRERNREQREEGEPLW